MKSHHARVLRAGCACLPYAAVLTAHAIVPPTQLVPDGVLGSVVQVRGSQGSGTGSIIDKHIINGVGYLCVLTADHVVANATNLRIGFGNGAPSDPLNATILGEKGPSGFVDVAVLKAEFGVLNSNNMAAFNAIVPMSLAAPPQASTDMIGADISVSGYGRTGDPVVIAGQTVGYQFSILNGAHAYGTKRFANNRISTAGLIGDPGTPNYLYDSIAWELDSAGLVGEGGIMSGDSGGPVMVTQLADINGIGVRTDGIIGIITRTAGSGYKGFAPDVTSSDLGVFLNSDYQTWIQRQCASVPEPATLPIVVGTFTLAAGSTLRRRRGRA